MKKALMYASVASMIQQFNMDNIRTLMSMGYQVDVACNLKQGSTISEDRIAEMCKQLDSMGCRVIHIPIPRKITALNAIWSSFKESRQLMEEEKYDLIHCHSPIGGMICRLANRTCSNFGKTRMIYTAHGFHFYKGAPMKNWMLFYPVEKLCARWTDVLITINHEDFDLAKRKFRLKHSGRVEYVPGVGINIEKFSKTIVDFAEKRRELGVPESAVLMCSVGELNANKNHGIVIKAMSQLHQQDIHYVVAGTGEKRAYLMDMAKQCGVEDRVHLLGYRRDVAELYKVSNIFVFPSLREGLPVSMMEAMAAGLPIVCSKIRGNVDLIDDNGGEFFNPDNVDSCVIAIQNILNRNLEKIGAYNRKKVSTFSVDAINQSMRKIYNG